ncbi:hypothetical protein ABIE61_002755 [Marinobacterium sp. MBR-111]|jgi:hypothetical protein|uniref:hypothetical protein n=1 Tax=Marinobacterium sp. MBR-111 TaxID=3156463 RepID=UPI00339982E0
MKGIDKKIREIKEQKVGNSNRRVLVVEGADDVQAFELMLAKLAPDWNTNWVLAHAGKKAAVLEIIQREPSWIGVVDRDEWDSEKIAQLEVEQLNLCILPRYCIENYLIVPSELWDALPPKQQAKIPGGQQELREKILRELDKWVRHGVLWSVVNPLWEGLRSRGFKEALLAVDVATNDEEILRILNDWHSYLTPDEIWSRYQTRLRAVEPKSVEQKLTLHIHGKLFYEQVVNPILNQLLGQKRADDRQFAIMRTLPPTADLIPVLAKLDVVYGGGQ